MRPVAFLRRRNRTTFVFCRGLLNIFRILSIFVTLSSLKRVREWWKSVATSCVPLVYGCRCNTSESEQSEFGSLSGSPLGPSPHLLSFSTSRSHPTPATDAVHLLLCHQSANAELPPHPRALLLANSSNVPSLRRPTPRLGVGSIQRSRTHPRSPLSTVS